jgi:hypothetical protein
MRGGFKLASKALKSVSLDIDPALDADDLEDFIGFWWSGGILVSARPAK